MRSKYNGMHRATCGRNTAIAWSCTVSVRHSGILRLLPRRTPFCVAAFRGSGWRSSTNRTRYGTQGTRHGTHRPPPQTHTHTNTHATCRRLAACPRWLSPPCMPTACSLWCRSCPRLDQWCVGAPCAGAPPTTAVARKATPPPTPPQHVQHTCSHESSPDGKTFYNVRTLLGAREDDLHTTVARRLGELVAGDTGLNLLLALALAPRAASMATAKEVVAHMTATRPWKVAAAAGAAAGGAAAGGGGGGAAAASASSGSGGKATAGSAVAASAEGVAPAAALVEDADVDAIAAAYGLTVEEVRRRQAAASSFTSSVRSRAGRPTGGSSSGGGGAAGGLAS